MSIPAFGRGTFRLQKDVVINPVKTALEVVYRIFIPLKSVKRCCD